jgi:hypothetical protein
VAIREGVREAAGEGRDRDHEREVEQQLELTHDPMRLVGRPGGHPVADLSAHSN